MKLKNKLFSVAAAGMLVFSNVTTAVVSANDLTTMSEETQKAIYSSNPGTRTAVQTSSSEAATQSTAITTNNNVVITNNVDKKDTIEIKSGASLKKGDVVRIYDSNNKKLAEAKASKDDAELKITLSKNLGSSSGTIQISRISLDAAGKKLAESTKAGCGFSAEATSSTVTTNGNVKVVNELTKKDTIIVTHTSASPGTVISVYKDTTSKKPIASAKLDSNNVAKISLKLDDKADKIYITATEKNKLESDRVAMNYALPTQTSKATAITSVNNKKSKDVVTVTGVATGETIKVYAGTKKIGETKAKSTTATVEVTLPKVGEIIGATRTAKDMRESDMTTAAVTSVATSSAPTGGLLVNNTKGSDYVLVTGLTEGDVVTVYDKATGGDKLGTGKVAKNETQAYVKLKNTSSTTVHVSATSVDKEESATRKAIQ